MLNNQLLSDISIPGGAQYPPPVVRLTEKTSTIVHKISINLFPAKIGFVLSP
ncbi:hypothetical protein B4064_1599 [Caldibacillus thermoamylovorans]|uniref:Uncharacterized protein n=1 Tax=Caldibacillus thermoamylovorans TaxID=35841 RepID=A0ABD4A7T3_9BACI|nr:hypothetical protein B4064_1599 [Caldibacillus thermoamylovorans]KIO69662.1 hypothetical protein B4166_1782 [Caldibacillus thermoamylovorans]KIO72889.1 hypothetical protein B4167_2665 [Caldibacillus thermoamylovorans]